MGTSLVAAIAARVALVPVVKIRLTLCVSSSLADGSRAARLPLTLRVSREKILPLLIAETFELFAQASDRLGLGAAHFLHQNSHSRLGQRKHRNHKKRGHYQCEEWEHVEAAISVGGGHFENRGGCG